MDGDLGSVQDGGFNRKAVKAGAVGETFLREVAEGPVGGHKFLARKI